MPIFTDQLDRQIQLESIPKKIISLVPSQTELLHYLGLEDVVLGITKFCIHPEKWFRQKERVGGTKNVNIEKIRQLKPDLIIANKEENIKEQIEELAGNFPLWVSDVNNLEDALVMVERIGELTAKKKEATQLSKDIQTAFNQLQTPDRRPRTAYLIWKDPYMTVGVDTFIHAMLQKAGFDNVFVYKKRYPVITIEEIKYAGCEVLFLSSEPYPFQQKHVDELQAFLPGTKIMLVDGELFSWYGSRLLHAPAYFNTLQQQIRLIV